MTGRLNRGVKPTVAEDTKPIQAVPDPWRPTESVEVSLKVGHHINMGNYEHLSVDSWVKMTVPPDADMARVGEDLRLVTEDVLRTTLKLAYETTDESKSYIKIWPIETGE